MNTRFKREKGQALVILTMMLLAFLAILALTLDGGLTFAQRRKAQNAADAAALAGAHAMCVTGGGDPVAAALEYAARNGITDPANVVVTNISDASKALRGVRVEVTLPYETAFSGLIGVNNTLVRAVAEAGCYPPCSGSGLLPIAWSCSPPIGGSASATCDVDTPNVDGRCQFGVDPMYIVADSNTIEEDVVCQDALHVGPAYVDCDINDDGILDIHILSGGSRAWLDLNGGGGGASELIAWVSGGYNGPPLRPHTWFPGQTGVDNSVYQAIENREGDIVTIPVFDAFNKGLNVTANPAYHPGVDTIVGTTATSIDYFHVMTFATFMITCVDAPGTAPAPCPAKEWLVSTGALKANVKTVEGCFLQGLFEGSGKPGECTIDAGAYVLKLLK